jgi:hypothetical protein
MNLNAYDSHNRICTQVRYSDTGKDKEDVSVFDTADKAHHVDHARAAGTGMGMGGAGFLFDPKKIQAAVDHANKVRFMLNRSQQLKDSSGGWSCE